MNVLLMGACGVMGRRYQSILKHLNHTILHVDFPHLLSEVRYSINKADAVIIATPTMTHTQVILELSQYEHKNSLPILCEKPVTKYFSDLEECFEMCKRSSMELFVVNQYAHLPESVIFDHADGVTSYNYFNSGRDGLKWDCFQMFALAKGKVNISNESPYWECEINGVPINVEHMDGAYVRMVDDFLGDRNKLWGEEIIRDTTAKIINYT